MSRGPGKVQRDILHELRSGRWRDTYTLAQRLYPGTWTPSQRVAYWRALGGLLDRELIEHGGDDPSNDRHYGEVRLTADGRSYLETIGP